MKNKLSNNTRNAPLKRCVSGFVTLLCLGVSFLFWSGPTWALGISPASIVLTDLSPQSKIQEEIYISRANPKSIDYVSVTVTGSGAKAIQIENKDRFELPQGKQITPLPITVAPVGFALGEYEAEITVQTIQSEESQGGSTILTGAQAKISFILTNSEIKPFVLDNVTVEEVFDQEPLVLVFQTTNNSANEIRFGSVELEIQNQTSGEVTQTTEDASNLQAPLPFTQTESRLPSSVSLVSGEYTGSFTLFDTEQNELGQQTMAFTVKEKAGVVSEQPDSDSNRWLVWMTLGSLSLLAIASIGVFLLAYFSKKRI